MPVAASGWRIPSTHSAAPTSGSTSTGSKDVRPAIAFLRKELLWLSRTARPQTGASVAIGASTKQAQTAATASSSRAPQAGSGFGTTASNDSGAVGSCGLRRGPPTIEASPDRGTTGTKSKGGNE